MMLALALLACAPDDVTDGAVPDTAEDTAAAEGPGDLTGSWLSEGDDISELFRSSFFDYTRIDASFDAGGSYLVTAVDAEGASYEFVGTYVVDVGPTPGTITLTQTSPYAATSAGIWQVTDEVLTYEVVQTSPDYGYVPPTPEAGFGSTTGPNLTAGVNVQTYRRP